MATKAQNALTAAATALLATAPKGKAAPAPVAQATPAPVATPAPAAPVAQAVAVQHKATPASGPAFKLGTFWPVAVNSHRGYAQAVASHLAASGTFTLGALRAALVANPLPVGHPCQAVQPPKGGWAKHNMPTWGAAQGWWVQA